MQRAIVLFAHGARAPEWAAPFLALRERVAKAQPDQAVELAYLELMEPRLPDVIDQLANAGAQQIRVVPVFLGAGSHVRRDLPELVAAAQQRWPDLRIDLEPPLGERTEVLDALATAVLKAGSA